MRTILGEVWRKELSPEEAFKELTRAGPKIKGDKRKRILTLLSYLHQGDKDVITVSDVEEELREEGIEYEDIGTGRKMGANLCQIN